VLIIVSTKRKRKEKEAMDFWSLVCWRPNSLEPGMNKAFFKRGVFVVSMLLFYLLLLHIL
jgi:hypothetical protein